MGNAVSTLSTAPPRGVAAFTSGGSEGALAPAKGEAAANGSRLGVRRIEPFIPVTQAALIERLTRREVWAGVDVAKVRRLHQLLALWRQVDVSEQLMRYDQIYESLSPDSDLLHTRTVDDANREAMAAEMVQGIERLLVRANFTKVAPEDVPGFINTPETDYGLDMWVDLDAYDRLVVYFRGDDASVEKKKHWRKFFRVQEFKVPIYRRLFVLYTRKPVDKRLAEYKAEGLTRGQAGKALRRMRRNMPARVGAHHLYMKLFKNIPKADLELAFPNVEVKFRPWDKLWFLASTVGAFAIGVWGAFGKIEELELHPMAALAAFGGLCGIAIRQGFNLMNQHRRYLLTMARNLHFHAMADNRGAMAKIADRAVEEETKEDMLLYSVLARAPATVSDLPHIATAVADFLKTTFDVTVAFDVMKPFDRLKADGILVESPDGALTVLPPEAACERIIELWQRHILELPAETLMPGVEVEEAPELPEEAETEEEEMSRLDS